MAYIKFIPAHRKGNFFDLYNVMGRGRRRTGKSKIGRKVVVNKRVGGNKNDKNKHK